MRAFRFIQTTVKKRLDMENIDFLQNVSLLSEKATAALESRDQHCIILHGWGLRSFHMQGLKKTLQQIPAATKYHFWTVDFPSRGNSFREVAAALLDRFALEQRDFSRSVLIGYSMGGLVAREMVARGFACQALVSLCAPHGGVGFWIPGVGAGVRSLRGGNRDLEQLNEEPRDKENRGKYSFFAITHRNLLGLQAHDTVVPERSALGSDLAGVGYRHTLRYDFGRRIFHANPHLLGLIPGCLLPVIKHCEGLFAAESAESIFPGNIFTEFGGIN